MTEHDYAAAIATLAPLALGDTGGSGVAAQTLLSAFNGRCFQLDIVDLCTLDCRHYEAALAVIRGRVELGIEPHGLIDDGDRIFTRLWEQWQRIHVANRGLPDCYTCRGSGSVYVDPEDDANYARKPCSACGGKGYGQKK